MIRPLSIYWVKFTFFEGVSGTLAEYDAPADGIKKQSAAAAEGSSGTLPV